MVLTDLQKLSLDVYNGAVTKFSVEAGNDALREAINEACGGKFDYYGYLDNKGKVFAIVAETLSIGLGQILVDQFNGFAETHDIALGDKQEFIVQDDGLFRVAQISTGNWDIRRQTIYNRRLAIATYQLGIKIYTDLELFQAGRIDWSNMVDRVQRSYAHEIGVKIYEAVYGAYDQLSAPYKVSGTWSEDDLLDAIAHVEAETGQKAVVYGTAKGLRNITSATVTQDMNNTLHELGHYGKFYSTELRLLPQAHTVGGSTFAVNDSFLLVIPDGEKFVKIVLEGDATVFETEAGTRSDMQMEFFFGRKVGIGVLVAKNFAIYRIG